LVAVIESGDDEQDGPLADDASLIKSGRLDSLGLYSLALFIEREVGHKLDITSFDLVAEWDTVREILDFILRAAN
jgi:acyl carrier protein